MATRPRTFRPSNQPNKRQVRRESDRMRGSARKRGYSSRWDRASKRFLQEYPLCVGCLALGRTVPAVCTDHVIPHKGDAELFWDPGNWQGSCGWHHNVVKQILETMFAQGAISKRDLRLDGHLAKAESIRLRP